MHRVLTYSQAKIGTQGKVEKGCVPEGINLIKGVRRFIEEYFFNHSESPFQHYKCFENLTLKKVLIEEGLVGKGNLYEGRGRGFEPAIRGGLKHSLSGVLSLVRGFFHRVVFEIEA